MLIWFDGVGVAVVVVFVGVVLVVVGGFDVVVGGTDTDEGLTTGPVYAGITVPV